MTKKRVAWADPETLTEEEQREGESLGFSLSGLLTVDLQRQTIRIASAAGVAIANHPDNRIDFDMTGGTMTIPPGWQVKTF